MNRIFKRLIAFLIGFALAAGFSVSACALSTGSAPEDPAAQSAVSSHVLSPAGTQPSEEVIEEEEVPLAAPRRSAWALFNLILMVVTALESLVLLAAFCGSAPELEDFGGAARRRGVFHAMSLIPAVGAILLFLLTEDLHASMAWSDAWTPLMAGMAVMQLALALLAQKESAGSEKEA